MKKTLFTINPLPISYIVLAVLTLVPAIVLLWTGWNTTGTPQGDGYIQDIFTILHYQEANTIAEKISNTWWSYFQHRGLLSKLTVLLMYFSLDRIDIRLIGLISNLFACGIVLLLANKIIRQEMGLYCSSIASLMILSLYPYTVIAWPECMLFYYGTLFFALLCFFFLDLEKPQILMALLCSWMATLTMANGVLSILIGCCVVLYQQHNTKKYSARDLVLWFSGSLACITFHLATTNVFSTDLYGAKSLSESFINISGRLLDFIESMGATPFFPNEHRTGKILLGSIFTALIAKLIISRKPPASLTMTAFMLFSTGTLFLTSLFRYSAGGNDGYQIFTSINMAMALILATQQISKKHRKIILPLLVLTAIAFNLNVAFTNTEKLIDKNRSNTKVLEEFLISGKTSQDYWIVTMLQESIMKNIYRPLSAHALLRNSENIDNLDHCPEKMPDAISKLTYNTSDIAFANRVSIDIPKIIYGDASLLLCGSQNYRIKLSKKSLLQTEKNTRLTVLLDKRRFTSQTYRAYIETPTLLIATNQPLPITAVQYSDRTASDCRIIRETFQFKTAFLPIITHYCQKIHPVTQGVPQQL